MLLAINACPIMHEPGIRPPKAPFGINSVWTIATSAHRAAHTHAPCYGLPALSA